MTQKKETITQEASHKAFVRLLVQANIPEQVIQQLETVINAKGDSWRELFYERFDTLLRAKPEQKKELRDNFYLLALGRLLLQDVKLSSEQKNAILRLLGNARYEE